VNAPLRFLARNALPHRFGRRLPIKLPTVEFRPIDAPALKLLDVHRDQIARDIYWGGGQPTSPADARVLRLVELLSRDVETFLDIGSYSGLFAMLAARSNPKLKAVAYEIVPENYLLVVRNVIANDLVAQVDSRLLGLGCSQGSFRIPSSLGASSNASSISLGSCFSEGVNIPITTMDEQAKSLTPRLAMKIDVEGFELEVLRGGIETLRDWKPDIICEVLPGGAEGDYLALESLIAPLGYRFYQSLDGGFTRRKRLVPSSAGRDWIFSAREDIGSILDNC
jgi:FkbM family methyltransferase